MKKKTVVVVIVIALLVAALGYVTHYALEDKNVRATKQRVKIYRIVEEEQRSILRIMQYKIEIAKIQKAFTPVDPNDP